MSLTQAVDANFAKSTKAEMLSYFDELGVAKPHHLTGEDKVRKLLLQACGKDPDYVAPQVITRRKRSEVIPPYNLIPGRAKPGGRLHRIRLHRPGDTPANDAGKAFSSGGHWSQTLTYEAVELVPECILNAVREPTKGRGVVRQRVDEQGNKVVYTEVMVDPAYRYDYLGVDDATKDLAGSLHEWYQTKGESWFRGITHEQVREITQYINDPFMLPTKNKQDMPLDAEHLRENLINFFLPQSQEEAA